MSGRASCALTLTTLALAGPVTPRPATPSNLAGAERRRLVYTEPTDPSAALPPRSDSLSWKESHLDCQGCTWAPVRP
jgi:hypothetical protein